MGEPSPSKHSSKENKPLEDYAKHDRMIENQIYPSKMSPTLTCPPHHPGECGNEEGKIKSPPNPTFNDYNPSQKEHSKIKVGPYLEELKPRQQCCFDSDSFNLFVSFSGRSYSSPSCLIIAGLLTVELDIRAVLLLTVPCNTLHASPNIENWKQKLQS